MGVLLSLVPRIEALASPYQLNEQRRSPRQYEIANILASDAIMHEARYGYIIPMDVIVALFLTIN